MLNKAVFFHGTVILTLTALLPSCDVLEPSQRFTVTYEVSGTFSDCTVFYITRRDDVAPDEVNQGGQSLDEDVTIPWSHTFDVTVTPMFPFNTQISAVCTDTSENEVEVLLLVDGELEDSAQETGRNVNALAEYRLVVN